MNLSDPSILGRIALIVALLVFALVFFFRKKLKKDIETFRKGKQGEATDLAQAGPLLKLFDIATKIKRFISEYLRVFIDKFKKKGERKKPVPTPPSQL